MHKPDTLRDKTKYCKKIENATKYANMQHQEETATKMLVETNKQNGTFYSQLAVGFQFKGLESALCLITTESVCGHVFY